MRAICGFSLWNQRVWIVWSHSQNIASDVFGSRLPLPFLPVSLAATPNISKNIKSFWPKSSIMIVCCNDCSHYWPISVSQPLYWFVFSPNPFPECFGYHCERASRWAALVLQLIYRALVDNKHDFLRSNFLHLRPAFGTRKVIMLCSTIHAVIFIESTLTAEHWRTR